MLAGGIFFARRQQLQQKPGCIEALRQYQYRQQGGNALPQQHGAVQWRQ
jgi:hypothetical protein